jgi:hypothetical protein
MIHVSVDELVVAYLTQPYDLLNFNHSPWYSFLCIYLGFSEGVNNRTSMGPPTFFGRA